MFYLQELLMILIQLLYITLCKLIWPFIYLNALIIFSTFLLFLWPFESSIGYREKRTYIHK